MAKSNKKLSTEDLGILLFIAALIFGAWFRINPILNAGFPINDGGLFNKMIETLLENDFRLPDYVEYNNLQIPFAYPPLAFYLAGFISRLVNISILELQMWMPATIAIIILPAIFYLSKILLNSTLQAGIATFLYALLPRSITWIIMGGGITRSLGQLFLILAVSQIYLLFTTKQRKYIISSIIFSALVCITHPEAALHTLGIALVLWLFFGRTREGVYKAFLVGMAVLLFTSPWWMTILLRFGLGPYLAAGQTGYLNFLSVLAVFLSLGDEPLLPLISIFAILGIFVQVAKKQYFLPLLFIAPLIIEPRSAPNVAIIPMVMLASICLTELIFPALSNFEAGLVHQFSTGFLQSRTEKIFWGYIIIALLINMQIAGSKIGQYYLSPAERTAMAWIKTNSPRESRFIVITGDDRLFSDYSNEWFPLFTERQSYTTIQGYEWMKDPEFGIVAKSMKNLQQCVKANEPLACIESEARSSSLDYQYIVIKRNAEFAGNLLSELQSNRNYENVYKAKEVMIFRKLN